MKQIVLMLLNTYVRKSPFPLLALPPLLSHALELRGQKAISLKFCPFSECLGHIKIKVSASIFFTLLSLHA